jgi:small subunit ribosomal protein S6
MRDYEIIFIVHPELDQAGLEEIVTKVKGWITDAGGTITKQDIWGKRRLANSIRKQREGQYVQLDVQMPPTFSRELERNIRFIEPVMRFMITSSH